MEARRKPTTGCGFGRPGSAVGVEYRVIVAAQEARRRAAKLRAAAARARAEAAGERRKAEQLRFPRRPPRGAPS
ncbi:MAG: hypothetical protein LC792_20090 [Actinobacteria bacterium]|nr:hypothetical protein [Actinomycetota bacterium]